MDQKVEHLMRTASELGEVCTGAYGYLSALVDNFLHAPGMPLSELREQFYELQAEVTRNIERIMSSHGYSENDVVAAANQAANALGMGPEERAQVVRLAMDFAIPGHRVTET